MTAPVLGPREGIDAAAWVPDEEVKECPLCVRVFGYGQLTRKHHCRSCGRVVCSSCSGNTLVLSSASGKQRVCDNCFEMSHTDKAASLTEQLSKNRQVEASLKADLKEKHFQAEWFKSFLVQIEAEAKTAGIEEVSDDLNPFNDNADASASSTAVVVGATPSSDSPPPSPREKAAAAFSKLDPEVQRLVSRAKLHWAAAVSEAGSFSQEEAERRSKVDTLRQEGSEKAKIVNELEKRVKSMESDLKNAPQIKSKRDELQIKVSELQKELDGLTQRAAQLEKSRPSPPGSFLSSFSRSVSVDGDTEQQNRRCTRRRPCVVM